MLAFGRDGKARRTILWQCSKGAIPRLDREGNIYLAEMIKPPGRSFPEFFDGKIEPPPEQTGENNTGFYYSYMYGSIVKFPPGGGAAWYKPHLTASVVGEPPAELGAKPKQAFQYHAGFRSRDEGQLQGALWTRFGFAPYTCVKSSCYRTCMCEGGGFEVDPYGRVFYPNLGRFRVEVLDTGGNPITTFGRYGNQDDFQLRTADREARSEAPAGQGPAAGTPQSALRNPQSEIPLAWPITVATSETHAYVADTLSRRVARVRLGWTAEETCAIK
jgi:hypothetical protein